MLSIYCICVIHSDQNIYNLMHTLGKIANATLDIIERVGL